MKTITGTSGIHLHYLANPKATTDLWIIPGFTEEPNYLYAIQNIPNASNINFYWVTLPGFGSPMFDSLHEQLMPALTLAIEQHSNSRPIVILGHSLGGTIATELISLLSPNQVKLFLNIEGMLVEDAAGTARSLSQAGQYQDADQFVTFITEKFNKICHQLTEGSDAKKVLTRYLKNITKWPTTVIHQWSLYCNSRLKDNVIAKQYDQLNCATRYIRGENSMSHLEQQHITEQKIPAITIPNASHWPMIENQPVFLETINQAIEDILSSPNNECCCSIQ